MFYSNEQFDQTNIKFDKLKKTQLKLVYDFIILNKSLSLNSVKWQVKTEVKLLVLIINLSERAVL